MISRVFTGDGEHFNNGGPLPRLLVNFAVAFYSACFYRTETIGAVLPLVYSDAGIAAKIVEDPATAPISEMHKAMYAWVKKFVRGSSEMSADDIEALRDVGVSDQEVVVWAQIATMQSYFVVMGDGGGVSLDEVLST